MRGAGLDLYRVHLPLRRPFHAAHGTETLRDVILVRWTRLDGVVGWGECPTLSTFGYADEITATAWSFLRDVVGPVVADTGTVPWIEGSPMAAGAVRDARLDADLRADGRPLWREIARGAPDPGSTMPWTRVLGLDDEVPPTASSVKLKVTPASVDRLRDVRDRHPHLGLAADANGSFAHPDDLPKWLDDLGLAYLEQPLPPGQLDALRAVRSRLGTPIALDESVHDLSTLHASIASGALDLLSLKPARVGGVERAVELAQVAADAGVGVFVGGMLETGIGRAVALGLARGLGARAVAAPDLGPSAQYFEADVTEPITTIDDGGRELLVLPGGPGIGRVPDPARLAAVTVDTATFRTA